MVLIYSYISQYILIYPNIFWKATHKDLKLRFDQVATNEAQTWFYIAKFIQSTIKLKIAINIFSFCVYKVSREVLSAETDVGTVRFSNLD